MYRLLRYCLKAAAFFAACSVSFAVNASPAEQTPSLETHRVAEAWAATVPPREEPSSWGNLYISAHIGGVYLPEMDFVQDSGARINTMLGNGIGFGATFGYKFPFGLRLETEFTYRSSEIDYVEIPGFGIFPHPTGNVDSASAMFNAWYEIDFLPFLFGKWAPYAGAGAGYAKFWADPSFWFVDGCGCSPPEFIVIMEATDTALVWQAGAGLVYKYTDDVQISIDYRLVRSFGELVFNDPFYLDPLKTDYQTHSIFLGFRGTF